MKSYSFGTTSDPACASRVCRLKVAPATRMCSCRPEQADRLALARRRPSTRTSTSLASTIGDAAAALDLDGLVGADESRRVLVEADADRERVVGQRREQAAEPVALAEVLVDDEAVGEAEARREAHAARDHATSPRRRTRSCARSGCWRRRWCRRRSRRCALRSADQLGDGRAAEQRREAQLVAAGEEDAGRLLRVARAGRVRGSRAGCRSPST